MKSTITVIKEITSVTTLQMSPWEVLAKYPSKIALTKAELNELDSLRMDIGTLHRQWEELVSLRPDKAKSYLEQRDKAIADVDRRAIEIIGTDELFLSIKV